MDRSSPGAEEKGALGGAVFLDPSLLQRTTCQSPAEGPENQRGGQGHSSEAEARLTVKVGKTPASRPQASPFSQGGERPRAGLTAGSGGQWAMSASGQVASGHLPGVRTPPPFLGFTLEPPPGPQGPAVALLVGVGLRVCSGDPRGLPGGDQGRGSPRQGRQGAPPRGCSEHRLPQEEVGIEPGAPGLPRAAMTHGFLPVPRLVGQEPPGLGLSRLHG